MSNCWWLWALSVWKLFRACKDASINKHLNSYVCSVYPNAFSVPMKAILAGCGGHTFNPSGQQKQANLYETSLVYIGSSVQVSQKENLLFPTCLLIDYSHTPPFLYCICLVLLSSGSVLICMIFLLRLRSEHFIQWPAFSYVLEDVRNDISVAYMWNLLKRRLWGKLNLNNLSVYDLINDLFLFNGLRSQVS